MHGVIVISWVWDSFYPKYDLYDLHMPLRHIYLISRVSGGQSSTVLQTTYPIVKEYNKNVIKMT